MSGVEIKPGIWINSDHIARIEAKTNEEAYTLARLHRFKAKREVREYIDKTTVQFGEGSPEVLAMEQAGHETLKQCPEPKVGDYKEVLVTMVGGDYYWVSTDLYETLGIVGWDDGQDT